MTDTHLSTTHSSRVSASFSSVATALENMDINSQMRKLGTFTDECHENPQQAAALLALTENLIVRRPSLVIERSATLFDALFTAAQVSPPDSPERARAIDIILKHSPSFPPIDGIDSWALDAAMLAPLGSDQERLAIGQAVGPRGFTDLKLKVFNLQENVRQSPRLAKPLLDLTACLAKFDASLTDALASYRQVATADDVPVYYRQLAAQGIIDTTDRLPPSQDFFAAYLDASCFPSTDKGVVEAYARAVRLAENGATNEEREKRFLSVLKCPHEGLPLYEDAAQGLINAIHAYPLPSDQRQHFTLALGELKGFEEALSLLNDTALKDFDQEPNDYQRIALFKQIIDINGPNSFRSDAAQNRIDALLSANDGLTLLKDNEPFWWKSHVHKNTPFRPAGGATILAFRQRQPPKPAPGEKN